MFEKVTYNMIAEVGLHKIAENLNEKFPKGSYIYIGWYCNAQCIIKVDEFVVTKDVGGDDTLRVFGIYGINNAKEFEISTAYGVIENNIRFATAQEIETLNAHKAEFEMLHANDEEYEEEDEEVDYFNLTKEEKVLHEIVAMLVPNAIITTFETLSRKNGGNVWVDSKVCGYAFDNLFYFEAITKDDAIKGEQIVVRFYNGKGKEKLIGENSVWKWGFNWKGIAATIY